MEEHDDPKKRRSLQKTSIPNKTSETVKAALVVHKKLQDIKGDMKNGCKKEEKNHLFSAQKARTKTDEALKNKCPGHGIKLHLTGE